LSKIKDDNSIYQTAGDALIGLVRYWFGFYTISSVTRGAVAARRAPALADSRARSTRASRDVALQRGLLLFFSFLAKLCFALYYNNFLRAVIVG